MRPGTRADGVAAGRNHHAIANEGGIPQEGPRTGDVTRPAKGANGLHPRAEEAVARPIDRGNVGNETRRVAGEVGAGVAAGATRHGRAVAAVAAGRTGGTS